MKRNLTIILLLLLVLAEMKAQVLPFRLSKGAGTFRLGIVAGDKSRWLDECELEKTGDRTYIIKDALLGIGKIRLMICPLTDTKGLLVEVSGSRLPENLSLCWAFGACNEDEALSEQGAAISPEACRDNVFSDEENAFTVYYGASMALRVTQGIAPVGSELRLSDARRQTSPLELYHSGKKTDAPVISSLYSWNTKEKCYFCFYKQNAGADYSKRMRSPEGTPVGSMKRILISNVNVFNADSRYSSIISGVPGALIEDVTFSNIHIYHQGGYSAEDGQRIPPENEKTYPEPWMFGTIPAKGFYIRHARGVTLNDIHFHYKQVDGRPLLVTDDADGLVYRNMTVNGKEYKN